MGYTVAPAEGAFYAYVNTGGDDIGTARKWLEKGLVAVTPGSAFNTPGWQRISYATPMGHLQEAVRRIKSLTWISHPFFIVIARSRSSILTVTVPFSWYAT